MMGATAGRTTLTGEGLQHDDGQSHVLASIVPNVLAYDPAFAYELAIIVREGIDRMYGERGEDVFYYVTIYNENWAQPAKAGGRRGRRPARPVSVPRGGQGGSRRVQLLAVGPILQQALRAQQILRREVRRGRRRVVGDELPAAAQRGARRRALEPPPPRRRAAGPVRAPVPRATGPDRSSPPPTTSRPVPDMVSRWIDRPYTVLGTDGFGRSDTREALRTHFEVNAEHIAYAALHGLCLDGKSTPDELKRAIADLGIDPERVNPSTPSDARRTSAARSAESAAASRRRRSTRHRRP